MFSKVAPTEWTSLFSEEQQTLLRSLSWFDPEDLALVVEFAQLSPEVFQTLTRYQSLNDWMWNHPGLHEVKNQAFIAEEGLKNKPVEAVKGLFKCTKCGSEETISSQKQTRSADEPMTIFITCLKCGKKWRE